VCPVKRATCSIGLNGGIRFLLPINGCRMPRHQGVNVRVVIFLFVFLVGITANAAETGSSSSDHFSLALCEEFEIKEGQRVGVIGTGFEVEILKFFNQPCPPNVMCVWSGVGIGFQYWNEGQSLTGINLVKAFGYKTTIIKSDYESYAVLRISKEIDQ
jgi:hypothetical protein